VKAKHQRLLLALVALCGVAGAGVLAASALRDEAAYFRTPAEVQGGKAAIGEPMRLGGMVAKGSIVRQADGLTIRDPLSSSSRRRPGSRRLHSNASARPRPSPG